MYTLWHANCLSSDYRTTSNGKKIYICLKCYIECDALTYVEYIVFQSPTYMKALLFTHPYCVQLFYFNAIDLQHLSTNRLR
jgi:hypothetical protein